MYKHAHAHSHAGVNPGFSIFRKGGQNIEVSRFLKNIYAYIHLYIPVVHACVCVCVCVCV